LTVPLGVTVRVNGSSCTERLSLSSLVAILGASISGAIVNGVSTLTVKTGGLSAVLCSLTPFVTQYSFTSFNPNGVSSNLTSV